MHRCDWCVCTIYTDLTGLAEQTKGQRTQTEVWMYQWQWTQEVTGLKWFNTHISFLDTQSERFRIWITEEKIDGSNNVFNLN